MKKRFKLEELDCAHCASKMEKAINALDGVNSATVNFMQQKLTIDCDDDSFYEIMDKVEKEIKKIEPDCSIVR